MKIKKLTRYIIGITEFVLIGAGLILMLCGEGYETTEDMMYAYFCGLAMFVIGCIPALVKSNRRSE